MYKSIYLTVSLALVSLHTSDATSSVDIQLPQTDSSFETDTPESSPEPALKVPVEVSTVILDVGTLNVVVTASKDKKLTWEWLGQNQPVQAELSKQTLTLVKPARSLKGGISFVLNTGGGVSGSLQLAIASEAHSQQLSEISCLRECGRSTLFVAVPESISMKFKRFRGNAVIETDIESLDFSGNGDLQAMSMKAAVLDLSGNAAVVIDKIANSLSSSMNGNSKLTVNHGAVDEASISLKGNATVSVSGELSQLDIDLSGNASIYLDEVLNLRSRSQRGNADYCLRSIIKNTYVCK